MGFDWKDALKLGVGVASVALPGGKVKDTALGVVSSIISDPSASNEDATKALAGVVDELAKEVKKLRVELDALKKKKG